MAGSGRRTFTPGEVLTASNVMNYLQDQAVMNFAGTAARGSAIGSAVSQGMVSYLDDSNSLEVYKTVGTAVAGWEPVNLAKSPNVIINGAFDIWQRSTSTTSLGWASADRFWVNNSAGTTTVARESTIVPTGFTYSQKLTQSVANGNVVSLQPFESINVVPLQGKTVTLSAYVYGSASTAFTFDFNYSTSVDVAPSGSWTTISPTAGGSGTATASWQRVTGTYAVPSTAKSLRVGLSVTSLVSGNSFYWTGVQLEAGSTATPFRRNANSIQGELAACQRYYWRLTPSTAYGRYANGYASTTSVVITTFYPPVTMRTAPTSIEANFIAYSDTDATASAATSAGLNNAGPSAIGVNFGGTFTQFRPYIILANNNLNSNIAFNAEL